MTAYQDKLNKIKGLWPGPGVILVASPNLTGSVFQKSVILLCEAGEGGAVGLMLNLETTMQLSELSDDIAPLDQNLFQGGPVEINTLHFFHQEIADDIGSKEIFPGIYWGLDYERLIDYIAENEVAKESFRFFMGYAGWGANQLEDEIIRGDWFATPATGDVLFYRDAATIWDYTLRTMGPNFTALADAARDSE